MTTSKVYLHHRSNLGEFRLASDGAIQTFTMWPRASMKAITEQIPEQEHDDYRTLAYTVRRFHRLSGKPDRRATVDQPGPRLGPRSVGDGVRLSPLRVRLVRRVVSIAERSRPSR